MTKTQYTIEDLQLYALYKMERHNVESERLFDRSSRLTVNPVQRRVMEIEAARELGRSSGFCQMVSVMLGREDQEIARLLADTETVERLRGEWIMVSEEAAHAEKA